MKRQKGSAEAELLGYIIAAAILGLVALIAASTGNDDEAKRTAYLAGFKDVTILETHRFWSASIHGCGDDWKATIIKAKNGEGREVKIAVCEGMIFKGSTVRFVK